MTSPILTMLIICGIAFIIPVIAHKLGREYLIGLLPIYLLTGNVLAESFTKIGIFTTSFAIPIYAATFLITDILSERYGKAESQRAVWLGFMGQLFFVGILSLMLVAPIFDVNKEALTKALSFMPRLILGSSIAYLVSQFLDVWLFHRIRDVTGPKYKWVRNNAATMIAQLFDTFIFLGIAFYGRPPFEDTKVFLLFVVSTWFIKVAVAVFDTPFFYLATWSERSR